MNYRYYKLTWIIPQSTPINQVTTPAHPLHITSHHHIHVMKNLINFDL